MTTPTFYISDHAPVYTTSIAAQLAGLHPQTLRQYDRLGLVVPTRLSGRNRLYSKYDIVLLREVATLSSEGLPLAGVRRVLALQKEIEELRNLLAEHRTRSDSTALVLYRPQSARRT